MLLGEIAVRRFSRLLEKNEIITFFIIAVLFLCGSLLSSHFLSVRNFLSILLQSSINSVIAMGEAFVIISGGIDLSVGSVLALSGVVIAQLLRSGAGELLAVSVGLSVGAACGCVNGFLIGRAKIAPFIATLGMLSIARGLALILTGGYTLYGLTEKVKFLGTGYLWLIPFPVILAVVIFLGAYVFLTKLRWGLRIYAIGGNEEAARLSGVPVVKTKILVYLVSGLCAAIGGLILIARLNAAEPIAGQGYELNAIAACVIGGCSLAGGEGSVVGVLLGALIMGTLQNILNLLNVQAYYQQLIIGLVIIGAALSDKVRYSGSRKY